MAQILDHAAPVCIACKGTGLSDNELYRCKSCDGIGPFAIDGQPPWRAGERWRMVGDTKHYRCYSDYLD